MRIELQPAYVLHARAYRETSLLVDAFTEGHGRIGLLARGVRSARGQPLRALLQPFHPVLLSWGGRGELPLLRGAEAGGAVPRVTGEAVLAGFYVNELLLRLLAREDPHPALFQRYAALVGVLGTTAALGWELRRFERDLLEELGYGLVLQQDADGRELVAGARYHYDPDQGPVALGAGAGGGVSAEALRALGEDRMPGAGALAELRRLMRRVLLERLGGRELQVWRAWPGRARAVDGE